VSRIGKQPVAVPEGVDVTVEGAQVKVNGPKGQLTVPFRSERIEVDVEEAAVVVRRKSDEKESMALHGLTRSLINNAVSGVTQGYQKRLDVFGVGFRAEIQGRELTLHIGYSHPVVYDVPEGIELLSENPIQDSQARIVVQGIDKQQVGQVAAEIRDKRRPDPYKGKGIRYENETIHWKAGKAAVA